MADYMVIYIDVADGDIKDVYESDEIGTVGNKAEEGPPKGGQGAVVDTDSWSTFGTESSPICRYVRCLGRLRRVCKS
jgi:hypothetical protein